MRSNGDSHSASHANAVVSHAACGDGWGATGDRSRPRFAGLISASIFGW